MSGRIAACAAGRAGGLVAQRAGPAVARIARGAPGAEPLAMHVQHAPRPAAFMQVVDILGDDQQLAVAIRASSRPSASCAGIGLRGEHRRAALVVEALDQIGIAAEALGRGDLLDRVILPQPVLGAEGSQPAFGGDSGTGQDHDIADVWLMSPHEARPRTGKWQWRASDIIGSEGRMGQAHRRGDRRRRARAAPAASTRATTSPALADGERRAGRFLRARRAARPILHAAIGAGIPILVGTTGLDERAPSPRSTMPRETIAVLQTGNTSLGVTLLAHLVREAAAGWAPTGISRCSKCTTA